MTTTNVSSGPAQSGLVANSGDIINVLSGGTIVSATISSGGSATISVGGIDSGSTILAGGNEYVYGSANADVVAGLQTVSTGTTAGLVTNETVVSGGEIFLSIKTTSASNTTVQSGGLLALKGAISATNTTLSGGEVALESAQATLTGSLVFAGGGTLAVTGNTATGAGDLAVISGFAAGDVIDMTSATTIGAATSDTLSTTVSSGNTVVTVSGGGLTDTYLFAGTSIGATLALVSDSAGGQKIIVSGAPLVVTSVGSGVTQSNVVVSSGAPLTVYAGGTIVNASVLSGGSATISSGGVDSGATISAGGSENLLGSANADSIFGSQALGTSTAVASNETIQSGGSVSLTGAGATISGAIVMSGATLNVSGAAAADNTTIEGGAVNLVSPQSTLGGNLAFNGPGTLDIAALSSAGAGDQAVISGFGYGDVINIAGLGAGATLSTTISGGNTVATITSGGASETLIFSGSVASGLALSNSGGTAEISYAAPPTTTSYTAGDLVLSIYGNGAGTGVVTLDQAAPITLEEITQAGVIVSDQVLPQVTTVVNGTTEYAISGEYQSASEGLLTLAANGQSIVIMGYGVTATAFDASNAATVYGTTALGQTSSLLGGPYTAVARVVADISFNGSIDTSTAIYGIDNTNNPRSVATVNGTTFYLSGQGNGNDGTQGVFVANDGANSATAIYNTKTDTRDAEIINGQLYVSVDSKLNGGGNIFNFGSALPTGATTPTVLAGIGTSIVLTAAQANVVNGAAVGTSVNLSPEQFFMANATTMYVADGGVPKEGGPGDGGLQKWSLVSGTWVLDYTLSTGLNMIANTGTTGTTGLVGLAGTVEGGNVVLYATNETVAETDPSYLYAITDALAATALPTSESFTLLETAAPGTLIRGVTFAPTASSTTPQVSTTITVSSGVSSSGLSVTGGGNIIVMSGGSISGTTLLSGGATTVSSGGVDSGTFVAHGATEMVLGQASYDIIDGVQTVSAATAVVTSETVEDGGTLDLFLKGAIVSAATVMAGGTLNISGNAFADNTVISGGAVILQSPKAVLSGFLDFVGTGGTIEVTSVTSAGYGDLAVISGFGGGDVIDERVMSTGATLSTSLVSGNVVATVTSGAVVESFTFAGSGQLTGSAYMSGLSLVADGLGGVELNYTPPVPVDIIVSSGVTSTGLSMTSGNTVTVLSGGTLTNATILAGGSAVISAGGVDSGTTVQAGGYELVSGSANGDQIYGIQNVTSGPSAATLPATVSNETVFAGGTLELYLKPDVGTNITVSSGGSYLLSGNVSGTNTTLEAGSFMALESPKATLSGSLTFNGAATLDLTVVTSAGFGTYSSAGSYAVISGFSAGDVIDETLISSTAATLVTTTSAGQTFETINGAAFPETFVFNGTAIASNIALVSDGGTGVELVYEVACFVTGTLIETGTGPRAVETLVEGDLVLTRTGALQPIVWLGRRHIGSSQHPLAEKFWPVRVQASAFAEQSPRRDLYLSPEHAIFHEGALFPIGNLVNNVSIAQVPRTEVTYWHIELATHDVVLAEGLEVETYLENGNRGDFENNDAITLHPGLVGSDGAATSPCFPFCRQGENLQALRDLLATRIVEVAKVA
jgi:autotransporter passenger strand-loop-strand repeat protein